jgi:molybdopterin molybdotransferase
LVHGVNVRPGKPTILAVCAPAGSATPKPVIGLPGNPVSALVIASLFVIPALRLFLGLPSHALQPAIPARLAINVPSQAGREDWVPVKLNAGLEGWSAEPVFGKSNFIISLARADGLVRIPPADTGLSAGTVVDVILL